MIPLQRIKNDFFCAFHVSAQSQGKYQKSLDKAEKTLKTVQGWSDEDILNREEIIANLHSQIGNAHLEMGNYNVALDHHEQDLEIGEQK